MALKPKRYHRLWPALLLSLALSTTLHAESVPTAQPDPALARGFAPEQLFQGYAELDNVNAFNGNLVIPIPLGQEYPLGGDLAYQLTLTYNSQAWDIDTVVNALGSWNKARPAHPNGLLAGVEHTNGASYALANDPHGMRRPLSITLTDATGIPATLGPFSYDGASNMTASGAEHYVFDEVSRLAEATFGSGNEQRYAFDVFGNMTSITTVRGGVPSTRAIGVSPSTNRLTSAAYDAAGNVTAWNGNAYEHDAVSMMTTVNGSKLHAYTADDMRILLYDSEQGEERWRLRGLGQKVLRENVRTSTGWSW